MKEIYDLNSLLEEYDLSPKKISISKEEAQIKLNEATFNIKDLEKELHIAQHPKIEQDYWEDVKNTLIERVDNLPLNEPRWIQALKNYFFSVDGFWTMKKHSDFALKLLHNREKGRAMLPYDDRRCKNHETAELVVTSALNYALHYLAPEFLKGNYSQENKQALEELLDSY